MVRRGLIFSGALVVLMLAGYRTGFAQVAWERVLSFIALQGKPVVASPPLLSEHELQELAQMTPQQQAERLVERAINHYEGATERIAKDVDSWRGSIEMAGQLNTLLTSALNSNDLRVRAAAIEVDLAANNVEKTAESVDSRIRLLESGETVRRDRVSALWLLGLLGNRGVEPERVFDTLLKYTRDPDASVRHWAVEGLAYLGTDATIEPLLEIFRTDPSADVRERAACGLAQSGMLQQSQRMKAVPALLNYLDDPQLDPTMHRWVIQALQDISGQRTGDDSAAWRRWYSSR
jgi:HEAT repeat protein